jgi:hypothetical protein
MTATVLGAEPDEPRGTGVRADIPEAVKRALYAMSNGTCYAPECAQPACIDTGVGGIRLSVEVAHIYGVKPNAPRFRADFTDKQRDDWRHLMLLCEGHHRAVDDPKAGERNYPATMLLEWKAERERRFGGVLNAPLTEDGMERLLVQYFEEPSERLAKLVGRLDDITQQAERTGRVTADNVAELRLVVGMLRETDAYRLAESARALSEAADIYATLNLSKAANSLADTADLLGTMDLGQKAQQLHSAAEQLRYSTRGLGEY